MEGSTFLSKLSPLSGGSGWAYLSMTLNLQCLFDLGDLFLQLVSLGDLAQLGFCGGLSAVVLPGSILDDQKWEAHI